MPTSRPPSPPLAILFFILLYVSSSLPALVQSFSAASSSRSTAASATSSPTSPRLFPYQQTGVSRLLTDRRVLLADEMGLGKTIQSISAINRLSCGDASPRVLIVCLKSVLNVWVDELERWLDPDLGLDVHVATGKTAPLANQVSGGTIQLINYDICHKHRAVLQAEHFDVLICDEAHYLKSPDTKRTLAVLGDGGDKHHGISSDYLWLLTGTPIMNRPVELYPLLRALDSNGWGPMKKFVARYCDPKEREWKGQWSVDARGASNFGELSDRLKPYMVRRYKADVLTDLPPKLRSCVILDGADAGLGEKCMFADIMAGGNGDVPCTGADSNLATFGSDASALPDYLPAIYPSSIEDENQSDAEDEQLLGRLAKIRKRTALRKLGPAVQLLKDAILSHKVVVFAHHRRVILDLVEEFGKSAVYIMGGISSKERADAVRRFQNDDSCRLFVGSIRAAGVGITLTAASHVVFLELDLSPAIMVQAEDRCHRIGQNDSVQVQYYVFKNSVDEWIVKKLIDKRVGISMALPVDAGEETSSGKRTASALQNSSAESVDAAYVLDFGKHEGVRLEDAPRDYISFLIETDNGAIYGKRPALWKALARLGLVEVPPCELVGGRSRYSNCNGARSDNRDEEEQTVADVDYVFDFGKHRGRKWRDVPKSYKDWVISNGVHNNRKDMKEALLAAGLIER